MPQYNIGFWMGSSLARVGKETASSAEEAFKKAAARVTFLGLDQNRVSIEIKDAKMKHLLSRAAWEAPA